MIFKRTVHICTQELIFRKHFYDFYACNDTKCGTVRAPRRSRASSTPISGAFALSNRAVWVRAIKFSFLCCYVLLCAVMRCVETMWCGWRWWDGSRLFVLQLEWCHLMAASLVFWVLVWRAEGILRFMYMLRLIIYERFWRLIIENGN